MRSFVKDNIVFTSSMVLRMKEYEREKRLIQRGKRKEKKLAAEGMSEEMPE